MDTFIHQHLQIIQELAITLKQKEAYEEFTTTLMDLISNAQMVDPKFVINLLNPNSKEKNILLKGKISPIMTKLRFHNKILGKVNVFNKQWVWDDDPHTSSRKSNSKKEECYNLTVYVSMVTSSKVEPQVIIEWTLHKWSKSGGTQMII